MTTTTLRVSEDTLTGVNDLKKDKLFSKKFPDATNQDSIVNGLLDFWRIQKDGGEELKAVNDHLAKLELDIRELEAEVEKLEKEKEAILAADSAFIEGFAKERARVETAKNNKEAAEIRANATLGAADIRAKASMVNTAMREAGKANNFMDLFGDSLRDEKIIPSIFTKPEPKKLKGKKEADA